jgi:hypothetical protein
MQRHGRPHQDNSFLIEEATTRKRIIQHISTFESSAAATTGLHPDRRMAGEASHQLSVTLSGLMPGISQDPALAGAIRPSTTAIN